MIEPITISENSVATAYKSNFTEVKEAPRGRKAVEKQPKAIESPQHPELIEDI